MRPEHWLYTIPLRLRSLFRREQADRELDDELRDHLDRKTEEYVARGMTQEEAHRRARIDLDGIEQSKEKCRDARRINWIQDFSQDLRFGLRMLRKSPGFTAVAVLTLALGIGANSAVFSILDAVLIRPLPYPQADRLVKVDTYNLKSGDFYGKTSYPDFSDWSQQAHFFAKLAAYEEKPFNLAGILQPERIKGDVVSPDFFETLGIQPHKGRSFAGAHSQQAVVLSYPLWSRSFGSDPGVIGKSITLDGYSYDVIGVMPPGFQFPDLQTELWVGITPVRPDLREEMAARGTALMSVVGRLKADVTLDEAQAGMTVIASGLAQKYPASNRDLGVRPVPLQEYMVGKFRPALLILMGSAGLVLLIACANIGTLLLSRAAARQTEIGIRSSLGATRARIVTQLLIESLLLAVVGGTLGVFGAFLLLSVVLASVPKDIPRISSAHIDLAVLGFSWLISLFAGILFGLAPAWQISHYDLDASLKQDVRGARERKPLTRIMVVSEFAMSVVLLAAAGLLAKSLLLLYKVDPGFRTDHLLTVEVYRSMSEENKDARWRNWTGFYQQLLARIEALPGVESAGATLALPIQGRSWTVGFKIDGHAYASLFDQPVAEARIVSNNFFDVMKIPLLRGRYFSDWDTKDSLHVAVINEAVARTYWPNEYPVGRFIDMPAFSVGRCEIVGVVRDVQQSNLRDEPSPGIYLPYTQEFMPWQTLVVRTKNDPLSLSAAIRREVTALDPQQAVGRIAAMDQLLDASTAQPRFRTFLLGSFAVIALLLSAAGIYGVMAYAVSQRTHEMGIRMALGARPVDMLKLIFTESMTLASLGVFLGLIGASGVTRVLKSLLFGVSSTDRFTFVAVTLLLCSVALLASYIPARRAMCVDPMVALRHE
jgi:putative ABC transport system permease protein